jgi:hypothetical protein
MKLAPTITPEDHARGCEYDKCGVHFGCDCGETITVCRGGNSRFPQGHGEDFGECAYRKAHPNEETVQS